MKMKDSGIEWIGEIPETWEKVKFNAIYSNRNTKVSDRDYTPLSVTKRGIVPQLSTAAKTNDNDNRKLVKSGDFVINSRSDRRGSCGISSLDGSVSLINTVLEPISSRIEPLYFDFLFHTIQFADEFYKWGHGIVNDLWTTNWNDMKNITLIFPSRSEQQQIANFLDRKATEIDELIDKINDEIEKLQQYQSSVITRTITKGLDPSVSMKDSGIEWIGEIPETWKVIKAKYIFIQRNSKGNKRSLNLLSPTQNYGVIPQTMYEKISGMKPVKIDKQKDLNFFKTIHKGDFCISLRSFEGGFEYSHYEGVVSPAYQVFYCTDNNSIDGYYKYLFKDKTFINKMNSYTMSLRDGKNIAFSDFGNTFITVPPKKEQQKIANFLDQKVSQIQKVIKIKQQQINQLTEYKNSLIFEYVTGKKQVEEAN